MGSYFSTPKWIETSISSWDQKMKTELVRRLQHTKKGKNILLYGIAGSGKSSFINAVFSALSGYKRVKATVRSTSVDSNTKTICPHTYPESEFGPNDWNFTLYDMEGLSKQDMKDGFAETVTTGTFRKILTNVEWDTDAKDKSRVVRRGENAEDLRIDILLVFVEYKDNFQFKHPSIARMQEAVTLSSTSELPIFIVLTKIDEAVSSGFDIANVHHEEKYHKAVKAVSQLYGIPEGQVLIQSNYHGTSQVTDVKTDTLTLYNLWFPLSNIS